MARWKRQLRGWIDLGRPVGRCSQASRCALSVGGYFRPVLLDGAPPKSCPPTAHARARRARMCASRGSVRSSLCFRMHLRDSDRCGKSRLSSAHMTSPLVAGNHKEGAGPGLCAHLVLHSGACLFPLWVDVVAATSPRICAAKLAACV